MIIYDQVTGAQLSSYSGIFRASEVAAWHAAAVICFTAILVMTRRMTSMKWVLATMLALTVVALGMITGRRKFLVEILVFVSAYATLLVYFGRGAKLAVASALVGLLAYLAFVIWVPNDPSDRIAASGRGEEYANYVSRTKGVFGDIPERFAELGVAPISWAYNQYGLLGGGLGIGSQGAQQFGGVAQGAAEGGLGKIWLELGAPGFVIVVWLALAFTRHIWNLLKFVNARSKPLSHIAFGLVGFLLANIAAFAVATQVYADVFVLILLGTALGALLAMPVLVERALFQNRVRDLRPVGASALAADAA
jgi:hypothetical protein